MESGQVFICKLTMPKLLTTKTTTLHLTISINAPVNLGLITDQSRQLELFAPECGGGWSSPVLLIVVL